MKTHMKWIVLTYCALVLMIGSASAAASKTYQVTGPVVQVTDTSIVITKGTERWEIAKDAATKITGDLKVGSKVTIQYTMAAATVDVKPAAATTPVKKQ